MAPFDDEAVPLEERLAVADGERLNARDGGVRDGEFGPAMSEMRAPLAREMKL